MAGIGDAQPIAHTSPAPSRTDPVQSDELCALALPAKLAGDFTPPRMPAVQRHPDHDPWRRLNRISPRRRTYRCREVEKRRWNFHRVRKLDIRPTDHFHRQGIAVFIMIARVYLGQFSRLVIAHDPPIKGAD